MQIANDPASIYAARNRVRDRKTYLPECSGRRQGRSSLFRALPVMMDGKNAIVFGEAGFIRDAS